MSGRFDFKGHRGRQNDKSPRKLYDDTEKKPSSLHNDSRSCSLIYDNTEFPSLSESAVKISNVTDSEIKSLKYSDKLKLSPPNQNQCPKLIPSKDNYPRNFNARSKNSSSPCTFRSKTNKEIVIDTKKSSIFPVESINNQQSKHSLSHPSYAKQARMQTGCKNYPTRQINLESVDPAADVLHSTSRQTTACNSRVNVVLSKPSIEDETGKEIKCKLIFDKCKLKNEEENGKIKKKKRKSKVKRQAALMTGKINVLTPEVHSKILNQSSALNSQNFNNIITDINDEEEYPELGKSCMPLSQKENATKRGNIAVEPPNKEQVFDGHTEEQPVSEKEHSSIDKSIVEKKEKNENKSFHPNDPITVALFDMLMTRNNSKAKEKHLEEEVMPASSAGLLKVKSKKCMTHAPNLLDSSKPAVKRGKERENPKPKKPSHLKKIILLDRKLRREQLLQIKGCTNQEEDNVLTSDELQTNDDIQNINASESETEENSFSKSIYNEYSSELPTDIHLDKSDGGNDGSLLKLSNDLFSVSSDGGMHTTENSYEEEFMKLSVNDGCDSANKQEQNILSKVTTELAITEKHLNVLESNDSLLKSLSGAGKTIEVTEKEKAAKILLHTRNFREYCNHLVSKDIDDAVHALLDDLARFQDRMHQKDPVKARMKRRMIYGVKEVKKHIKLKKLKCIIIAADIENVETEGGLNDILNDIKSLAADHNISCVFALSRKALGKVCHKPVPVSCIGVFNSEGSEVNFKKIVELLTQSKKDYSEILNKLTMTISEKETEILLRAKKEAPETLHEIRANMFREIFLPSRTNNAEGGDTNLEMHE